MWDLKKNPPETMDVAFLFWNHKKIGQHLLPLKVRHRNIELWIDLFKCIFWLLFFLSINLIHIKHRHDISVLKSFNNSQHIYFHSKCLTARLSFELYLCFFIYYSFIHSLIHIFFTIIYLFHYLIYINQVWHFCFEIVQ